MDSKYYENWHLAKSNREFLVTEFEWSIIRFYEAFMRWVTTTGSLLTDADLKFSEHLILHVIRMQNRPKSGAVIARMINRDDIPNVQYSLRKLEAAKLIKKIKEGSGKTFSYVMTDKGNDITEKFSELRKDFLINHLSTISNIDEKIDDIIKFMSVFTGIYEEMARNSSTLSLQY